MLARRVWLALAALLATLAVACQWRIGFNNDNAWLLYVASRVARGARLYIDLIEINPPLIVWLNLPVVWLARLLQIDPVSVYRAMVAIAAAVSAWSSQRLVARAVSLWPAAAAFTVCVVVLFVVPVDTFGQREHLVLIALLPYLALTAGRLSNDALAVRRSVAAAVGASAGVALALKPHFIGVWFVSLFVAWRHGRLAWRWLENRVVLAVGVLYVAAVVAVTPQYIALVRFLGRVYGQYRTLGWAEILVGRFEPFVAVVAIAIYAAYRRTARWHAGRDLLAGATAAALLAVVLQGKGFGYHYYPALGLSLLLASAMAWSMDAAQPAAVRARRLASAFIGLVALPYLEANARIGLGPEHGEMRAYHELERAVGPIRDRPLLVLAPRSGFAFGLVTYAGAKWVGKLPCLWIPPVMYPASQLRDRPVYHAPAAMPAVERWAWRSIINDAVRARPEAILVGIPTPGAGPTDYWFDFLAYYSRDARFSALLSHYHEVAHASGYRIFRRNLNPADSANAANLYASRFR